MHKHVRGSRLIQGRRSRVRGEFRLAAGPRSCCLWVGGPNSSAVEVAASPPAVRLGPELSLKLHEAQDPGAVGAEVGLDVGGRLTDGGQVDAEQLGAPLQRRRDRPAQVQVVPGPHRTNISNTSSRVDRERCVVRRAAQSLGGPRWGATQRNLGDSRGQQGLTNLEVSGRPKRLTWPAKLLE